MPVPMVIALDFPSFSLIGVILQRKALINRNKKKQKPKLKRKSDQKLFIKLIRNYTLYLTLFHMCGFTRFIAIRLLHSIFSFVYSTLP